MTAKSTRRGIGETSEKLTQKEKEQSGVVRMDAPRPSAVSCPPPDSEGDAPKSLRYAGGKPITLRRHPSSDNQMRTISQADLAVVADRRSVVPRLSPRTSWEERSSALEPRDAFVLSRIDGTLTVEELADLTGMTSSEVLAILQRATELGFVELSEQKKPKKK